MIGFLKTLATAAMLVAAPMAASALTVTTFGTLNGTDTLSGTNLANTGVTRSYAVTNYDDFSADFGYITSGQGNLTYALTAGSAPSVITVSAKFFNVSTMTVRFLDYVTNNVLLSVNLLDPQYNGNFQYISALPLKVEFSWNASSAVQRLIGGLGITATPIPAPLALLLVGLAGVGYAARRKQLAAAA